MWILPKNLHTSDFVPDTEALSLDLNESSRLCAQSLFVRSKPSQLRIWSQKWKRDSWTQHLFGRILKPSHGQSFVAAWISSLAATHASHSAAQDSEKEQTTQDTSGHLFQPELLSCDQVSVSLKTSKDISRWGCPTLSKTWDAWVIEQRGEYSVRLNAARLTSAKECSSWPTAAARDWKGCGNAVPRKDGKHRLDTLEAVVMFGPADPANPSTHGSRPESWATPQTWDHVIGQKKDWENQARSTNLNDQVAAVMTQNAKLNPRWVETLMGLPVGWTMPSCQSPVTIAPTNCACLATELSQLQRL